MSDEATGKSGKTRIYVVGLLVCLPLFYVLSIGPVAVLAGRNVIRPSLLPIYRPLEMLAEATNTDALLRSYIRMWLRAFKVPHAG